MRDIPAWKQWLRDELTFLVNRYGRSACDSAETLYVRLVTEWYPDIQGEQRQFSKDKLSVVHQRMMRRGAARTRVQEMGIREMEAYLEIE